MSWRGADLRPSVRETAGPGERRPALPALLAALRRLQTRAPAPVEPRCPPRRSRRPGLTAEILIRRPGGEAFTRLLPMPADTAIAEAVDRLAQELLRDQPAGSRVQRVTFRCRP